jgi:hydroxymethylpyrimidine pyrophosphatase-like HAD family hydrolase
MARLLSEKLPRFEVHAAGFTTIDITRRGVDKAYGMRQIEKYLRVPIKKMIFVGDALFRGGNDAAVKKTGVKCAAVRGPKDTEKIIKRILE